MQTSNNHFLTGFFRDVPDFPKPGILFKDIAPLLKNQEAREEVIRQATALGKAHKVEAVAGVESRGFLFGMPLAMALGVPFIPIRKKGKLPGQTFQKSYGLEYGQDVLEIQTDAFPTSLRVWVHDDVLATGGTAGAAAELVKEAGGILCGFFFLAGIQVLNGQEPLKIFNVPIDCLLEF